MENEFDFFNALNFGLDFTKQGLGGYGTYTGPYKRDTRDTGDPNPKLITPDDYPEDYKGPMLSGIETIPGPIQPFINQDRDDDSGITTITSNDGFGGGYKSPYEDENVRTYLEDIGEGTIDYGDQKILNKMKLEDLLKKTPYYLLNSIIPFSGTLLNKYVEKKKIEKVLEEARIKREEEQRIADAAARELEERMTNIGNVTAAQQAQADADYQRMQRAYREDTGGGGGSYATGESGVQSDGSYNDPFDPGGGEKDGGHIDGTNRRRYGMGGIVTL